MVPMAHDDSRASGVRGRVRVAALRGDVSPQHAVLGHRGAGQGCGGPACQRRRERARAARPAPRGPDRGVRRPMSDSPSIGFRHGRCRLRVVATHAADLAWLVEFLVPWFEVVEESVWDWHVRLEIAPARYRAWRAQGSGRSGETVSCFILDTGIIAGVAWTDTGSSHVVWDAHHDVFYEIGEPGTHIRIVADRAHG